MGLMVGVQFASRPGEPIAQRLSKACLERDMLIMSTSSFDVIRWIPPLTVSEQELSDALDIFSDALEEVMSK